MMPAFGMLAMAEDWRKNLQSARLTDAVSVSVAAYGAGADMPGLYGGVDRPRGSEERSADGGSRC